jgi:hypothetical protein
MFKYLDYVHPLKWGLQPMAHGLDVAHEAHLARGINQLVF